MSMHSFWVSALMVLFPLGPIYWATRLFEAAWGLVVKPREPPSTPGS
jgi:hypothetical protein